MPSLTACHPYPAGPCPRGAAELQQRAAYRPPGDVHEMSRCFLRLHIGRAQFSRGDSFMPAASVRFFCGFSHHVASLPRPLVSCFQACILVLLVEPRAHTAASSARRAMQAGVAPPHFTIDALFSRCAGVLHAGGYRRHRRHYLG